MKRVAQQIADWLVNNGVTKVFTVTGGGSMFLNYELGNHSKMQCTFMHHEQACSMAAEGYARITGKPAVVMVTTGPGSINAFNGVYGAYTDSIPMIVISGQVKSETCKDFHNVEIRQLGDQEGPTVQMAKEITKFSRLVKSARDLETLLPLAYSEAVSGRPGPVWLDIPIDIQNSNEQLVFAPIHLYKEKHSTAGMEIDEIVQRLKKSHRPLILAGTGVRLSGAIDRLIKFSEKHSIPVATAWTHDIIPSDHALFAGRPGSIGTRGGNFCLQNSDLVLVIGSRLNIRQTGYNWRDFAKHAWLIQVDVDPAELSKPTIEADQKVISDAGNFLDLLDSKVDSLPDYSNWVDWVKEINARFDVVKEHEATANDPEILNPYLVVDKIINRLRDNDVIVCGNASACILPFQVAKLKKNQRLFSNSGSASMGYDLPAAIGAASANLGRVICFAGDGSLQMNIQELQTLKTQRSNVIIVVLNNRGYLSIKQTHENFFGKIIGATPESGVDFPDFCKVAEAYGIPSVKIQNEFNYWLLEQNLDSNGPLLIEIMVNPNQNFAPRMRARLDAEGNFIPLQLDDMYPFLDNQEVQKVRQSAQQIKHHVRS